MNDEIEVATCWRREPHPTHRWERILGGHCVCPGLDDTQGVVGDSPEITSVRRTKR